MPSFQITLASKATAKRRGRYIILLGPIGIGKSSLAAEFPKPLFLYDSLDVGCLELYHNDLIKASIMDRPYKSFDDLMTILYGLVNADTLQFRTIVIDGLTGFQRLLFAKCITNVYGGDSVKFNSFQNGPITVVSHRDYLPAFNDVVERLRDREINILLTGHSEPKTKDSGLAGKAYEREVPVCNRYVLNNLGRTAEMVGYILCVPKVIQDGQHKRVGTESERTLFVTQTPYVEAKNRFGCQYPIPFDGQPKVNFIDMCRALKLDPLTLRRKA